MPTALQNSAIGRINSLIEEINGVKTAAANAQTKRATELGLSGDAKQDPGGYHGKSDHPSARAASNVQKTPLGARAKENESDVKHDHPGAGVDNVSPGSGGSQDDKQLHVGMHPSATGEDPKVEDDYKGTKDDDREGERGGTSGPFSAGNIGEKYSSHSFADVTKIAYAHMNELLADVANGNATQLPVKRASAQAAPVQYNQAEYGLEEKQAAQAIIEQTIMDARVNADLVGEYLTKFSHMYTDMLKGATADGPMGGAMDGEAGGPPPGPPPGDPMAGGGDPQGPPPGAGGGEGGPEAGIDELINAALAMGATPEDIEAALQHHMGGGGGAPGAGGPPPGAEMGGAPGAGGPPMGDMGKAGSYWTEDQMLLLKAANIAKQRFRTGNWQPRAVQPGTKEAQERLELQRYILEVCGYGR